MKEKTVGWYYLWLSSLPLPQTGKIRVCWYSGSNGKGDLPTPSTNQIQEQNFIECYLLLHQS